MSASTSTPTPAPRARIEKAPATAATLTSGRTQIADVVVSKIAGLATREINGVYASAAAPPARWAPCASASPAAPPT